jgi:hypothetical protein
MDIPYSSALLVILGAGASYDSLSGFQAMAPPLSDQLANSSDLADSLLSVYPRARPVVSELRRSLEDRDSSESSVRSLTLEQTLRIYRDRSKTNQETLKQLTAFRFFLRDLLYQSALQIRNSRGGINNYTRLISDVYQWALDRDRTVCLVNFNYDPLLEWACSEEYRFNPSKWSDYSGRGPIYLLKPHGSVLWSLEDQSVAPTPNGFPSTLIEIGEPETTKGFELRTSGSPIDSVSAGGNQKRVVYPGLAMPIDGNKDFLWPNDQEELLTEGMPNGVFGKVLTIGWRGNEPHFVPLLRRLVPSTADLWMVTGDSSTDSAEIEQNLQTIIFPTTGRVTLTSGFSGFINSGHLQNLLAD